jgi:hypothetical protein
MRNFSRVRDRMVEVQIARRGVRDPHILEAMRRVPREAFVEPGLEEFAYEDGPLPISCLAAERCWDPVQYVIETEGWRFDGLRTRTRRQRRKSCRPASRGGWPGQPRRRRQAVARQGQG